MFLCLNDGDDFYEKKKYFDSIVPIALFLDVIFIFDMVINFVVLGPKSIWKEKKYIYYELLL